MDFTIIKLTKANYKRKRMDFTLIKLTKANYKRKRMDFPIKSRTTWEI